MKVIESYEEVTEEMLSKGNSNVAVFIFDLIRTIVFSMRIFSRYKL